MINHSQFNRRYDHPRSALKFDLFADASRRRKLDANGDPLQVIALHIDFAQLATLVDAFIQRSDARKGGRPVYLTEVMVHVLVLNKCGIFGALFWWNAEDKIIEENGVASANITGSGSSNLSVVNSIVGPAIFFWGSRVRHVIV